MILRKILVPAAALGVAFSAGLAYTGAVSHADTNLTAVVTPMATPDPTPVSVPLPTPIVTPAPSSTVTQELSNHEVRIEDLEAPKPTASPATAQVVTATPEPTPTPSPTPMTGSGVIHPLN